MRTLALDAAGASLSVAALQGVEPVAWRHEPLARGQAEALLPQLAAVMDEAGWRWSEIDLVVVTLGPGGFTGIRVGVAAARALCLAADLPALGVSTLEALAAAVPFDGSDLPLACLLDGRRGLIFCQRFAAGGLPLEEPELLTADEVERRLARPHRLAGPAAAAFAGGEHVLLTVAADAVSAARAAFRRIERGGVPGPGSGLVPLYLREADARPDAGRPLVAPA